MATLVYKVSSRTARATQRNPVVGRRILAALAEDQGSIPRTHIVVQTIICDSSSRYLTPSDRPPWSLDIHTGKSFIHIE